MALLTVDNSQRKALAIATVIAVLAGIWFLQNYIMLIAVAGIVAYLFSPIYNWLVKKGRGNGQAAVLTFLATLVAVIVPVAIVVSVTVFQVNSLVKDISVGDYSANLTQFIDNSVTLVNNTLDKLGIDYTLTIEQINQAFTSAVEQYGKSIASGILSSVSSFFSFITIAIIYIYVFVSLLVNKDKLLNSLSKLNPLGEKISGLYYQRMGAMTKATVRGQFIIALAQGSESAAVLALTGMPNLFFFFLLLLTTLSIIPLGAGIVTIPIGILMMISGNITGGAIIILNHLLIVTNIDNILRPKLVPKEARLDSALMMLSVFSGIAFFGFMGIVIGPVLMIVIVTTIQMFMEVFRETASLSKAEKLRKDERSILNKIKSIFT